ncbi:hypothetical protein SAY86_019073 [Trapa natans]|uniref:Uncharacterized protein n=1 Tax=Trapa natans TaxID=22666 RepID=A0AAN7LNY2_TRANT|nr:hypothetical protein SAY86_019073 [Trapa natans]
MHDHSSIMIIFWSLSHFPHVTHVLDVLDLLYSDIGQTTLSEHFREPCPQRPEYLPLLLLFLVAIFILFITFSLPHCCPNPISKAIDEVYICGILLGVLFMAFISDSIGMILVGATVFGVTIRGCDAGGQVQGFHHGHPASDLSQCWSPKGRDAVKEWRSVFLFFILTDFTAAVKVVGLPAGDLVLEDQSSSCHRVGAAAECEWCC